ncbi:hypothetical protein [Bacillus sp. JCM 19034]|uniref:hypothetical protein n=1 Tax=Bacillus sp. JCM 19034 TaxID=1481928 RepID=UPI00078378FC|nr:hypothetical protein [Bacillus sp. JCM 19034]
MTEKELGGRIDIPPFCYYDDIQNIIDTISEEHLGFSKKWVSGKSDLLNLNQRQIRHIFNINNELRINTFDSKFLRQIITYTSDLYALTASLDLEYNYTKYDLRSRIKEPSSIMNKIIHYRFGKEGKGKYAINKCLNDLFGLRIVIEGFDHNCILFEKMFTDIKDSLKEFRINIKHTRQFKGGYKATHIYFHGDSNKYFPWELQIWNKDDFKMNDESHERYKQEYTKWAKIHKSDTEHERGS